MSKMLDLIAEGGEVINRKVKWKWENDGERIMSRVGTAGLIASGVYAAKKTYDISDLLKETKEEVRRIEKEGTKKEIRKAKLGRAWNVGKHYILPVAGATLSSFMIDKGIAKAGQKTAAMAATATLYATTLAGYRKNVVEEYGADVDRKFMMQTKIRGKITEVEMNDGTKIKNTGNEDGSLWVRTNPNALRLLYSRETTPAVWYESYMLRKHKLESITNELNIMLRVNGHISLNDMRRKFGDARLDVGIGGVIGRIYDPGNPENPNGGRWINLHYEDDKDFIEGRKDWCWIIFEVDDEPIVNRMDNKFTEVETW